MSTTHLLRNVPVNRNLHPAIYGVLAGAVLWITLAVWVFFGRDAYTALQLAVVAAFAIAFAVTPAVLWKLSAAKREEAKPLRDWFDGEFDTYTGPVHGAHAAVMVLLAPAACAVGITGIALIAWLAAP